MPHPTFWLASPVPNDSRGNCRDLIIISEVFVIRAAVISRTNGNDRVEPPLVDPDRPSVWKVFSIESFHLLSSPFP